MYRCDDVDLTPVRERGAQFPSHVVRRVSGDLKGKFKPLRPQNGRDLPRHACIFRVAIPYGTFWADRRPVLAHRASEFDPGYGHSETRQRIELPNLRGRS